MTHIQKARDIFAKWRDGTHEGPWHRSFPTVRDVHGRLVVSDPISVDARLIVGTAGNPDLLGAIDGMFEAVLRYSTIPNWAENSAWVEHTERIAAAIISADERMNA